jgi:hypothetical protein
MKDRVIKVLGEETVCCPMFYNRSFRVKGAGGGCGVKNAWNRKDYDCVGAGHRGCPLTRGRVVVELQVTK